MKHILSVILMAMVLAVVAPAQMLSQMRPVQRIPLPGVNGRIDHLSCDVAGKRLFVAELGNGSVDIIDLAAGKRMGQVGNLQQPQGVLFEPGSQRLFVTTAGDGACRVFDTATSPSKLLATVPMGPDADNIRQLPERNEVVIGYNNALGFINVPTLTKIARTMPLAGHPESFLNEGGKRFFVNVPDAQCVSVRGAQESNWPLGSRVGNFPMALDEAHHRLLIGCRTPATMLALDTASGQVAARVKIGIDCDDLFYDARTSKVYAICGAGFVYVFYQQMNPERYLPAGIVTTGLGARTGLMVPELDRLFVAIPRSPGHEAEIVGYSLK